jgi:hypothetical protein
VFYLDKYEEAVVQIMKLGDKEREEIISGKKKLCICGRCPTYNECSKEKREIWYCAHGKSPECIKEKLGCLCPNCPIYDEMGLEKSYFCLRGFRKRTTRDVIYIEIMLTSSFFFIIWIILSDIRRNIWLSLHHKSIHKNLSGGVMQNPVNLVNIISRRSSTGLKTWVLKTSHVFPIP